MSTAVDVQNAPLLVIMFGMDGCDACEEQIPLLRAVAQRHPSVPTFAIDCLKQAAAADAFGVKATPTTVLVSRGQQMGRLEGMQGEDVLEKLFQKAEKVEGR